MGEYAYMNSGFAGPERIAVHEAIRRRLDLELVHGSTTRRALDDRYDLALRYRELMGRLLGGASPDEIRDHRQHLRGHQHRHQRPRRRVR